MVETKEIVYVCVHRIHTNAIEFELIDGVGNDR